MVTRSVLVRNILTLLDGNSSRKVSGVIAEFLLKNGRTNELQSILRDVSLARRESHNIVEVTAVSASPLLARHESEIRKNIKKLYPDARKVIINSKIDESLIGGIKLEFPDRQLDMSVESRITKLRELIS
jgi:ATP synthase F1 delta subunit